MNIKKITLIVLLKIIIFGCHTNMFSQYLAQIIHLYGPRLNDPRIAEIHIYKPNSIWPDVDTCYVDAHHVDPNIRSKLTEGSWVILAETPCKTAFKIRKILPKPNFEVGKRYTGIVNFVNNTNFARVTVTFNKIHFPVICALKKNINKNELVPNETPVKIKIIRVGGGFSKNVHDSTITGEIVGEGEKEEREQGE